MTGTVRTFSPRIEEVLAAGEPTPFVVLDLDVVATRYRELLAALGGTPLFYAVKANPHPDLVALLVELGCSFDVASWGEVELCREAGASADRMSFGNTIKRRSDIAAAFELGIRHFAIDAPAELDKVLAVAPGSTVVARLLFEGIGAAWPLSRKFGCETDQVVDLLVRAAAGGLGTGLSFHVGSQQLRPEAWDEALAEVAKVIGRLADRGVEIDVVNLGGGFPSPYDSPIPGVVDYGVAIRTAIDRHLAPTNARIIAEPGRALVGDAGVIQSEVLLVARKSPADDVRWVYLDVGVFTGLIESMGEAIRYPIRTPRDGGPTGPCVLAGPTCDSIDILYEEHPPQLPLDLAEGDLVELASTGAYTAACSSIGFNGFPPLRTIVLPATSSTTRSARLTAPGPG